MSEEERGTKRAREEDGAGEDGAGVEILDDEEDDEEEGEDGEDEEEDLEEISDDDGEDDVDDEEEDGEGDLDDEDDEDDEDEDDDSKAPVKVGSVIYVVLHEQEMKDADDGTNIPERLDTQIIAIASTIEKAEEIATEYTLDTFDIEDPADVSNFVEWLSNGYLIEGTADDAEARSDRVLIEAHELQ
mmetsp:Transcript_2834/g.6357  ORF Transcript_2834/g.6357 Transcript_2834/m.6357 type:complete len:187 (+) Transcript_2834:179-739(+)